MKVARQLLLAAVLSAGLAACSGGSGPASAPTATTQPPAPGANVDPNAHGVITDPINRAKTVVTQLNQQQSQTDGAGNS
ncbi:MAG TPA: hypothetical protein VF954_02790 [Acidimicrobiales bacterium]